MRALMDAIPQCVFVIARSGALLHANAAGRAVLGGAEDVRALLPAHVLDALGPRATSTQLLILGGVRRFDVRPHPWEGREAWLVCESADTFHHEIFETAPDAIFVADERGFYVDVNAAGVRLLGRPREAIVGQHVTAFVDPTDLATRPPSYSRIEPGKPFVVDRRMVRADGTIFPASIHSSRLPGGWIQGVVRDRSEAVRREEMFRQAEKLDTIGRLSGGIAHDFNNLLTVVGSLAAVLEAEVPTESGRALLGELQEVVHRGAGLTRQLLSFARTRKAEPRPVDVELCITNFSKLLSRVLTENIKLELCLCPEPSSVWIDPVQFEQVLLNLVVNARDAMPQGGTLRIATVRELDQIVVTVRDSGVGMSKETQARLFEPFFTTKQGRGTGLGLATAHGIVTQAQGRVSVVSAPDQGTTFTLRFTCCEPAARPAAPITSTSGPRRRDEVVVLVEDDAAVQAGVKRALTSLGFVVHATANPEEAMALLRSATRVDLLLTDIVLREGGGVKLAGDARAVRPELRVLFVSGHPEVPTQGLGPTLAKPFTTHELEEALARALRSPERTAATG